MKNFITKMLIKFDCRYFDTTYVNGRYRNKKNVELKYILTRTPPLFPPSIWNVFELTKAGIGRTNKTNNISEG